MQKIGDLHSYLVKVLTPSKNVNGTGFFCLEEGFILTCHHVIKPWLRRSARILVIHQNNELEVTLRSDLSTEAGDIAVLQLAGSAEHEKWPFLPLDTQWRVGLRDQLHSFGYPQGKSWAASGIPINGEVGGLTPTEIEKVKVYPIVGLNLGNVDGGYSGAPLVNDSTQRVVGLMHAKYQQQQAFIVPLEPLFDGWAKLRTFHDICRQIREQLAKEAKDALDETLKETPFIPLALEQGEIPEKEETNKKDAIGLHGRHWKPFEAKNLMQPSGKKLLSADVGSGKTTFLRSLANELFEKTTLVPLLIECPEVEKWSTWEDLKSCLIKRYTKFFLQTDLDFFFQKSIFLLLCDGLDQIPSGDYTLLTKRIFEIADDRPTLIATRPSAALGLEKRREILFLTLKPFSPSEQRRYFGKQNYLEAERICAMSRGLAEVPMLAFMIRTLITQRIASEVKTRTELYGRFLTHILAEHETNQPFFADKPGLTSKIRSALRRVAYHAIAQQRPQLQRVEASLYATIEDVVDVEELPRFGLVNLILARGDQHLLFFTHQSFQEFLAAQYLNEYESEVEKLMGELWNPKWANVILFLAGIRGQSFIDRILQARDNILHSILFLAAACAGEVRELSLPAKELLENRLVALLEHPRYWAAAIKALGQMRAPRHICLLLKSTDSAKCIAALNGLDLCGPESGDCVDAIAACLDPKRDDVSQVAIHVLERLGKPLGANTMRPILSLLASTDRFDRLKAATFLGQLALLLEPSVLEAVAQLLDSEDCQVCRTVIKVLGGFPNQIDQSTVQAIVVRLEHEIPEVRLAAVETLGGNGPGFDGYALRRVLARLQKEEAQDPRTNIDVRKEYGVTFKLGLHGWDQRREFAALDRWREDSERWRDSIFKRREEAIFELVGLKGRLDAPAINRIANHLNDTRAEVRSSVCKILVQLSQNLDVQAMELVSLHLENNDHYVRGAAVEILSRLPARLDQRTVQSIVSCLDDRSEYVRRKAIEGIVRLRTRSDIDFLRSIAACLNDEHPDVRSAALRVLKRPDIVPDPETSELILKCLEDENSAVRRVALETLAGPIKPKSEKIGRVAACLEDRDDRVREAAIETLLQLRDTIGLTTLEVLWTHFDLDNDRIRQIMSRVLWKVGEHVDPASLQLIAERLLNHGASEVRLTGLTFLKRFRGQLVSNVVPLIAKSLEDQNPILRQAALETLGRPEVVRYAETIVQISLYLEDQNAKVRKAALEIVEGFENTLDPKMIRKIAERLEDHDESVRSTASRIVARLQKHFSDESLAEIAARIDSENPEIRICAVKAFAGPGNPLNTEIGTRIAACLKDKLTFHAAVDTLTRIAERLNKETLEAIATHLNLELYWMREAALQILGRTSPTASSDVLRLIVAGLKDQNPRVRKAAIAALRGAEQRLDSNSFGWLVACLTDEDPQIRECALESLGKARRSLGTSTIEAMIACLRDEYSRVREAAIRSLKNLGTQLEGHLVNLIAQQSATSCPDMQKSLDDMLLGLYQQGVELPKD